MTEEKKAYKVKAKGPSSGQLALKKALQDEIARLKGEQKTVTSTSFFKKVDAYVNG